MSTKIVVVKLREVIKTSVLAAIGLIILGIIIYFFIPKNNNHQSKYIPGTYAAEIILHSNPVLVEVEVSKNEITDIQLLNMGTTQEVFYPLFERSIKTVANQIIKTQNTSVDSSLDNSMTTEILVKAVEKAINQAKVN